MIGFVCCYDKAATSSRAAFLTCRGLQRDAGALILLLGQNLNKAVFLHNLLEMTNFASFKYV